MEHINVTTEILDLEEARQRLEIIKPEVERLMADTRALGELQESLESADPEGARAQELREEMMAVQDRWRHALARINEQGGYVKDPGAGLLDFYTWNGGELVFLCWRHGEDTIETWHGLHEGFQGRKSVSTLRPEA